MQGCPLTDLAAYDYRLPEELIAKYPLKNRLEAKLLVVDRQKGTFTDSCIASLPQYCQKGDQIIFNDTKVIPARLKGRRVTGGEVEILLHTPAAEGTWWALTRPAKKLPLGQIVHIGPDADIKVIEVGESGQRRVKFHSMLTPLELLEKYGEIPLPHYMGRGQEKSDRFDYQTVYARNPGAVAAPTAGLHFTEPLLKEIDAQGIDRIHITLHVGLGTFLPVVVEDIRHHPMHSERCTIDRDAAQRLNSISESARRFCVGTTSVRTLESMADGRCSVNHGELDTRLFIYPGYQFKAVDALLTNFHLPKSTLLMLVSAFAGIDLIREAYAHAIKMNYRFYSYGDAMLII